MMRSIETGMGGEESADVKERLEANIPLHRYAEPDEIAKVMLHLASDDSSWVTGSVNMVDGGMTA
jgi:NAD(P)-dependent dehydrogenase (short-subunit alcohol dehydrogenase family)